MRRLFALLLIAACERSPVVAKQPPRRITEPSPRDAQPADAKPSKRATIEQLLARGPVQVHLDARRADVTVPAYLRADSNLVLRFGYELSPPINDLVVDDSGMSGTLTFKGKPFHCVLPWHTIFAALGEGDPSGTVWSGDVPAELRSSLSDASVELAPNSP